MLEQSRPHMLEQARPFLTVLEDSPTQFVDVGLFADHKFVCWIICRPICNKLETDRLNITKIDKKPTTLLFFYWQIL